MRHGTFVCVALSLFLTARAGNLKEDSGKQAANAKIDRLIKQLGDDDFAKREAASKELDALGEPALAATARRCMPAGATPRLAQPSSRTKGITSASPSSG